ncbi:competence protein CoiA family protein [Streptomyces phaeochromogenes]|uniref:competence protein CoiA family protein n=1 Tax=Streptomyces phaeochromogenes TaxID=1923 RepID=UPI0033CA8366
MSVVDTRLIQTAVIGVRDSDQPVILPEEPYNLDQFRRHFQRKRFWCGTLLGGCGGELMTKRYETKVCHFAHYPDHAGTAPVCDRIANGADSADHLFIKRDVIAWLQAQGLRVRVELRNLGTGPGDAVDFWLPSTHQLLRFQLCLQDYRTWYRAERELSTSSEQMDWLFGAEGPISANMVERQGYALRVKCETHGSDRRVLIGVERAGRPVTWSPLDDCRLTSDGLITPVLEELLRDGSVTQRGKGAWLRPATFPLRADQIVFAVDAKAPAPKHSPLAAEGRYIITADVKPAGSRIIRAHVSLPGAVPMPTEQYVYRLHGVARLLLTDPDPQDGAQWAVRADGVIQLSGIEAERTGLWRPGVALPKPVRTTSAAPVPAQRPAAETTVAPSGRANSAQSASTVPASDPETVARVRKALEDFARRRTPTTWSTLGTVAKLNLVRLSPTERRDLLIAVDRPATPDKPVLSALVRDSGGRPLPDMTTIIRKLGLQPPADDAALKLWCDREKDRAYHAHGTSSIRMIPARLAIGVDGRASELQATTRPKKRQTADGSRRTGALEADLQELVRALARGQDLLPSTSGPQYTRLSKAMKKARARLDAHYAAKAKGTAHFDWLKSHTDSLSHHAQLLVQAIRAAEANFTPQPAPVAEMPKPAQPTSPPVATEPGSSPQPTEVEEAAPKSPKDSAAEQFDSLIEQFREAQRVLDVDRAEQIYRMANSIFRTQLSPAVQHRNQAIVAEMKTWVGMQQPNRSSALLKRCRRLIHRMREEKDTISTEGLAALVAEAEALSERVTLPDADQKGLVRWQLHLQTRREAEQSAAVGEPSRNRPVAEGRLSQAQILQLASAIRTLLEQTARSQSLTTWGDLRRQLGESALPRLHPDDQGEVLVTVDHDTPADEPLLSSLIVVGDGEIHPLYRHVAFSLDRTVPLSDVALRSEWTVDVLRLRKLWKHR